MKMTGKFIVLISAVASLLVACGKDDNNGYGGGGPNQGANTYATLPQPANSCIMNRPYGPNQFPAQWAPQYAPYGFSHYGYNRPTPAGSYLGAGYPNAGGPIPTPYGPGGVGGGYPNGQFAPQSYPIPGQYDRGVYNPTNGFCGCGGNQIPTCDNQYGMMCLQSQYAQNQPYAVWNYNNSQNSYYFNGSWGSQYNMPNQGCYSGFAQTCAVNVPNSCGFGAICAATTVNSPVGICVRH